MKLWMDIQRDLEGVMYDHERILDAWNAGGVDGVASGAGGSGSSDSSVVYHAGQAR